MATDSTRISESTTGAMTQSEILTETLTVTPPPTPTNTDDATVTATLAHSPSATISRSRTFTEPYYGGGAIALSRHTIVLSGDNWGMPLQTAAVELLEAVVDDICSIIGLPRDAIFVQSMKIGSLVVEFTAIRNASQTIPDKVIDELIRAMLTLPLTAKLYRMVTNSTEEIVVKNTFTVKTSNNPANTYYCDTNCLAGIIGGSVVFAVLFAGTCYVIYRLILSRRRRDAGENVEPTYNPIADAPVRHRRSLWSSWYSPKNQMLQSPSPTTKAILPGSLPPSPILRSTS